VVILEMSGVATEHASAASANALSAIAAVSGVGAGVDAGTIVTAGVGTGVYVTAGVLSTGAACGLLVFRQPLSTAIRTTTARVTIKTDKPFIFL
jgi:hypothetical protein